MTATPEKTAAETRVEARKAAIIKAILDLLQEGGASALTTDAIAARARTSKATIYRYWKDKTQLLIEAANTVIQAPPVPDLGDFRSELHFLLAERLREYRGEGAYKVFAAFIGISAEDAVFGAHVRRWIDMNQMASNKQLIRRAKERGEIRDDISVEAAATIVAGPLVYRMVLQEGKPDRELIDTQVDCIVRGLAPVRNGEPG